MEFKKYSVFFLLYMIVLMMSINAGLNFFSSKKPSNEVNDINKSTDLSSNDDFRPLGGPRSGASNGDGPAMYLDDVGGYVPPSTPKPSTPKPSTPKPSTPEPVTCNYSCYLSGLPTEAYVGDTVKYNCYYEYYDCSWGSSTKSVDTTTAGVKTASCGSSYCSQKITIKSRYKCYRKLVEQTSSYNRYEYTWTTSKPSGYEETDLSEADCNSIKNVGCQKSNLANEVSLNATSCSGTFELPLSGKDKCTTSTSSDYYSINCTEKITTNFEPQNLNIKIGQGFKFDINVKAERTCNGEFNKTAWDDAYNKVQNKINKTSGKEKNWYIKLRNDLNSIVAEYKRLTNNYKSWTVENDSNNPKATLNINYRYKGQSKNLSYEFENTSKTGRVVSNNVLANVSLASGEKVEKFTSKIESTTKLIPPRVYLDYLGRVTTNIQGNNVIDGGNYFLSDTQSDNGEYEISISIKKLGSSEKGTINNNKCKLKLAEDEKVYRIISVSNPFNIGNVTPGVNWVGTNYNFEKVIDKNIWQENSLYTFDLSKEKIKQIKESNSKFIVGGNTSAYLGLCNQNVLSNDPTNEIICNVIK